MQALGPRSQPISYVFCSYVSVCLYGVSLPSMSYYSLHHYFEAESFTDQKIIKAAQALSVAEAAHV